MEETRRNIDRHCGNRAACMPGASRVPGPNLAPSLCPTPCSPRSPLRPRAARHSSCLAFLLLSPRQGLWALCLVLSPSVCCAFLQHELGVPLFSPHDLGRSLSPCPWQEGSLHPPFLPCCCPPVLTLRVMSCSRCQHVKAGLESELSNVTECLPH